MDCHTGPLPTMLIDDSELIEDSEQLADSMETSDKKIALSGDSGIGELSSDLADFHIREPPVVRLPQASRDHPLAHSMIPELDTNFSPPSGFEQFDNPGAVDYSSAGDVAVTTQFLTQMSGGDSHMCERAYHSMQVPNEKQKLYFSVMDDEGNTALHHSVLRKDISMVIEVVREASDSSYLNIQNRAFATSLHYAVQEDFPQAVAVLINRGANIRKFDECGNTPLHIACFQGDEVMIQVVVRFAMEKGHRLSSEKIKEILEAKNYDGCTCFHLVTSSGNAAAIRLVHDLGANPNAGDAKSGRTALHLSVEAGNLQLVHFLLHELRVDPNCETFNGDTALTLARGRNLPDLAEFLVKYGGIESQTSQSRDADSDSD